MSLKSIKDIENMMNKDTKKVLGTTVKAEMFEVHKDQIDIVYGEHDPKEYERRGAAGGLKDENNFYFRVQNQTAKLDNITPGNDNYSPKDGLIASNIEDGVYNYKAKGLGARPFIQRTKSELATSGRGKNSVKKGLKKIGYSVK